MRWRLNTRGMLSGFCLTCAAASMSASQAFGSCPWDGDWISTLGCILAAKGRRAGCTACTTCGTTHGRKFRTYQIARLTTWASRLCTTW